MPDARVPAQRSFEGLFGSPLRNLAGVVAFMLAVFLLATAGYLAAGWNLQDAVYMVILTIYTVGYHEVRPVDTPALHALTLATIVFGCTGMIVLTGTLVQVFTLGQLTQLMGLNRVTSEIDRLKNHVVICGFGRIGSMLSKDLKDGGVDLLVIDRSEERVAEARALGYLGLHADAVDEAALKTARIDRASVLATVLPDDAANVFITLSARSMNPDMRIIARGEQPSTERKLLHAGADKVVLPAFIGAERIAEMILHPETAEFVRGSERMREFDKTLRGLGLYLEVVTVAAGSGADGARVDEVEQRGRGEFLLVRIDRRDGEPLTQPPPEARLQAGDGALIVTRSGSAALSAIFEAPARAKSPRRRMTT